MKKTSTKSVSFAIILLAAVFTITSCTKGGNTTPATIPVIITNDVVIDAAGTTAHSGGLITETLTAGITAYGVCYSSSNQTPTIADTKTTDTVVNVYYTSKITGLAANTTYYLRAYAVNSAGTGYGNVITFKTSADLSSVAGTVTTIAGNSSDGFIDGTGASAFFDTPQGLTLDASGNLYVADSFNSAIRKITQAGIVTTLSGNGQIGYVDGPVAGAQFYAPQSLVSDAAGNIYVADLGNNIIRKISKDGVVSTFAGSGDAGYTDGTGTAASFNSPRGLAFDASGNLYVADRGNNLIRKITADGVVTTIAGSRGKGYIDSGTALDAQFNSPDGLAVDATGNVYVADLLNYSIRKVGTDGSVSTVLGNPALPSLVGYPSALSFDSKGNLFIVDQNGRILEITTNKVLINVAGNDALAGFADGKGTAALFNSPQGIVVDSNGNIWIADGNNNRIRKITL